MKIRTGRAIAAGALIGLSLTATGAYAQLGDMLKQAGSGTTQNSGGLAGNLGGLSGLGGALGGGGSSLMPSSLGNVAGVLQFCIQNQYLGGGSAGSVKDQLLGKLGGNPQSDSGFTSGSSGILDAGNGKTLDLSGAGVKQQLTKQVCDKVLTQAKSLL
ncbi:YjjA family protein [Burkholderia sp. 3C]